MPDRYEAFPLEIGVRDVHQMLAGQADILLLDCRNPDEFELVHIEGACFIPMGEIPRRIAEIEGCQDRRVVVYCHLGARSFQVASWLRAQGFAQAQSMAGGIDAWAEQVDANLPRY
jgi:rhodanese-related sulfurtransferase